MKSKITQGGGAPHKIADRVVPVDFGARAERRRVERLTKTKKTTKTNKRGFA